MKNLNRWFVFTLVIFFSFFLTIKSCKTNEKVVELTGTETIFELEELISSDEAYSELLLRNELLLTTPKNSNQIIASYLKDTLIYEYSHSDYNLSKINSDKLIKLLKPKQDNRQDYYMIKDKNVKNNSLGVAGVLYEKDILENEIIVTESYKNLKFQFNNEDKLLCPSVKFYEQKIAPFCSAFAISNDIIITAGHCIDENNLDEIVFVFDLKLDSKDDNFSLIKSDQIFFPKEILNRVYDTINKIDYAIIELEDTIPEKRILSYSLDFNYSIGSRNYIIGHPSGLPLKYAPDGIITQKPWSNYFQTNLNAFSGNSGSPIFNEKTHDVIGIFIAGENKFTFHKDDDCVKTIDCYAKNCTKEIGIKLSKTNIKDFLN